MYDILLLVEVTASSADRSQSNVSICTSREVFDPLLLQIEMLSRRVGVLSRSVTSRPVSAELVLQIETIAGEGSRHGKTPAA